MNVKEDLIKEVEDFYEEKKPQMLRGGVGLTCGAFLGAPFGPVGMIAIGGGLAAVGLLSGEQKAKEQKRLEIKQQQEICKIDKEKNDAIELQ